MIDADYNFTLFHHSIFHIITRQLRSIINVTNVYNEQENICQYFFLNVSKSHVLSRKVFWQYKTVTIRQTSKKNTYSKCLHQEKTRFRKITKDRAL